jgi:hypothetical protein
MYFCCCFLPLSIYTIPFLSKKVKKRDLHHFSRYVTCVTTLSSTPNSLLPSLDALVALGGQCEGAIVIHQEDNAGTLTLTFAFIHRPHMPSCTRAA